MRHGFISILFISLSLASCNNPAANPQKQEPPKALKDDHSVAEIVSDRKDDDLIESLYAELVDKEPLLQKLESDIRAFNSSKYDSSGKFEKFDGKINEYYSVAGRHGLDIKDSVLRNEVKQMLTKSQDIYNSSVSGYRDLLNSIADKAILLNDLHAFLKIMRTLPVIKAYESNNRPSIKPIEAVNKQLLSTIHLADSLSKK